MMLDSLNNSHDSNVLKIALVLDWSKPFKSNKAVPGTCIKLGFSLFLIIQNVGFTGCNRACYHRL